MPRRSSDREIGGYCKIRKRRSSSSSPASSSSSLVKNYRLKRAILVGKRVGSSTPIPTWKMALRSPSVAKHNHGGGKGKEAQTSCRRLAATLWEINGLQSPEEKENFDGDKMEKDWKSLEKLGRLLDQSHSPHYCKKDGSKPERHHRRRSSATSQKLQLIEYIGEGIMDSAPNDVSIKLGSHGPAETASAIKAHLKDLSSSLTASKELVKVLFRMWSQEEENSSRLTLVSALRVEIDQARLQVDQLVHEQRCSQKEIDALLKRFASEKAAWKFKEQERIYNAVSSVAKELEIEKKLRKQTERLNKRLGRELADTRVELSKMAKELECERRAREILEQTCDELAAGLGDDRAKAEEIKRESARVREEVERERQMLQLADVLREERVQMKLAEAKYEYEEKNAALEKLRNELESHLDGYDVNPSSFGREEKSADLEKLRTELEYYLGGRGINGERQFGSYEAGERVKVEEDGGEDSGESELHSIELNMDNLSKSYKWSFGNDGSALQGNVESRRASVDEVFKGRRSLSEKIQWENICLQRKTSDGIEWDFSATKNNRKASGRPSASSNLQSPSATGKLEGFVADSENQFDDNGDFEGKR